MGLLDLKTKYNPDADLEKVLLPPLPDDVDLVVAFDQALDNTGVVTYDGTSVAAWTIRSPKESKELTGHSRTYARSVALQRRVIDVLETLGSDNRTVVVLYEAPASAGRLSRPESSLLGGHCVEWACAVLEDHPDLGELVLHRISGQRAKSVVTGNSRADKAEVREALKATYSPAQHGACTNDHERDALALIVTWIGDKK